MCRHKYVGHAQDRAMDAEARAVGHYDFATASDEDAGPTDIGDPFSSSIFYQCTARTMRALYAVDHCNFFSDASDKDADPTDIGAPFSSAHFINRWLEQCARCGPLQLCGGIRQGCQSRRHRCPFFSNPLSRHLIQNWNGESRKTMRSWFAVLTGARAPDSCVLCIRSDQPLMLAESLQT